MADLVKKFNAALFAALNLLAKLANSDKECSQIERIKSRATVAINCMESSVVWEVIPFLLKNQASIIERDEKFFTTADVASKNAVEIFGVFKDIYARSNTRTKDALYAECLKLNAAALACAAE